MAALNVVHECEQNWATAAASSFPAHNVTGVCEWTQAFFDGNTLGYSVPRTVMTRGTLLIYLAATLVGVEHATQSCSLRALYVGNGQSGRTTLIFDAVVYPWQRHACNHDAGCNWPVSAQLTIPADAQSGVWGLECDGPGTNVARLEVIIAPSAEDLPSVPFRALLVTDTYSKLAYNPFGGASFYDVLLPDMMSIQTGAGGTDSQRNTQLCPLFLAFGIPCLTKEHFGVSWHRPQMDLSLYAKNVSSSYADLWRAQFRPGQMEQATFASYISAGGVNQPHGVPYTTFVSNDFLLDHPSYLEHFHAVATGGKWEYVPQAVLVSLDEYAHRGGHLIFQGYEWDWCFPLANSTTLYGEHSTTCRAYNADHYTAEPEGFFNINTFLGSSHLGPLHRHPNETTMTWQPLALTQDDPWPVGPRLMDTLGTILVGKRLSTYDSGMAWRADAQGRLCPVGTTIDCGNVTILIRTADHLDFSRGLWGTYEEVYRPANHMDYDADTLVFSSIVHIRKGRGAAVVLSGYMAFYEFDIWPQVVSDALVDYYNHTFLAPPPSPPPPSSPPLNPPPIVPLSNETAMTTMASLIAISATAGFVVVVIGLRALWWWSSKEKEREKV